MPMRDAPARSLQLPKSWIQSSQNLAPCPSPPGLCCFQFAALTATGSHRDDIPAFGLDILIATSWQMIDK
jgi:hypothetical protein